jgi:spermidine/putrescine-binding protein
MGKMGLMAGTAAIAMFAASGANATTEAGATTVASQPSGQVQLAQADMPPSNAELEARISALESEVQDSEMRAAQAQASPPPAPSGWWDKTSISGRMY